MKFFEMLSWILPWIIDGIKKFFSCIQWLKWIIQGKQYVEYSGFHCGLCGKWVEKELKIPKYKSQGKWADGWGICDNCLKI